MEYITSVMNYKIKLLKMSRLLKSKPKRQYRKYSLSKKRKVVRIKTKSSTRRRIKPLTEEQKGERLGKLLVSLWNSQQKPGKVYVGGYRIHHGLVGAGLELYGILAEDDYTKGLGKSLVTDDITDLPHWLNFENNTSNNPYYGYA